MSPPARFLRTVFRGWQLARSASPSPCRFVPTCSAYGIEALEVHGARRGTALVTRRLLRCNPWGPFGYDPVPLGATSAPLGSTPSPPPLPGPDPSPGALVHHPARPVRTTAASDAGSVVAASMSRPHAGRTSEMER